MAESDQTPESTREVRADRVATDASVPPEAEIVCVVQEVPVTIDVDGVETYTVLCTPTDPQAMAVGFLYTEGVIDSMRDVKAVKSCDDDPHTIRVRLEGEVPRIADPGRNLLIVSSCGACGSESLKERIAALPAVGDVLQVEAGLLRSVFTALRKEQRLFAACGGTHAAALFDAQGIILASAEDAGRHNALDKAIGKCLIADQATVGRGVALTSRLSLEMVSKCARAGIELVAAVSAPTSLAIDVAQRCNITLCAFVRETRATVFTHPQRIVARAS
jgi:FdhD protein